MFNLAYYSLNVYLLFLCTAGSEGHLAEETKFINLSLTSLGKCINALAENSPHIPTRDSKLTRLLRDSFGGDPNYPSVDLFFFFFFEYLKCLMVVAGVSCYL